MSRLSPQVVGARHGTPYGLHQRILCDPLWRVREATLSLVGDGRTLHLQADGEGNWRDGSGQAHEAAKPALANRARPSLPTHAAAATGVTRAVAAKKDNGGTDGKGAKASGDDEGGS